MTETFTAENRRKTCVHEAAHAIIFALGGQRPIRVAVAPVGARDWPYLNSYGVQQDDLFGACATAFDCPVSAWMMPWDEMAGSYIFNKLAAKKMLVSRSKKDKAQFRTEILAWIVGYMAGRVAEYIYCADSDILNADCEEGEDLTLAEGLSQALSYINEYSFLMAFTERTLKEPDVWAAVIKLADALEIAGVIECEYLKPYLPEPRKNWPLRKDFLNYKENHK